jgi:hypothetical protein
MRGADRGQKAGLIWLAEHRAGSSGSGVVTISCCPKEFPAIGRFGVSHLCHTFFPIWRQLDETTRLRFGCGVCSVGLRKLAGTNLGCQKVGVGHGPDEPEFVMVFRRLGGVRPLWFREFGLSNPNRNLSRRPAVQTDRPSARRDHVARCLSSHLSIIECTHRADGEDPPARPARWIMRTCLLLMWSDSNHSEDAVKSFPTTRMRRLWARYRSIEWPRHVGVRSAWHHARTPVCP